MDQTGIIVTNDHVVDGAKTITVVLADGRKFTPTAVKTNPDEDLAVLKINAPNLTAAQIGDSSKLMVGQRVTAIGNSLDMGLRVTNGVVSRLNVTITYSIDSKTNVTLDNLIETDTTINPGNSGGLLVDEAGNIIGITNAGLSGSSIDEVGFGYAIATNHALTIVNDLVSQLPK
jgi:S1-C subfamily serine protease